MMLIDVRMYYIKYSSKYSHHCFPGIWIVLSQLIDDWSQQEFNVLRIMFEKYATLPSLFLPFAFFWKGYNGGLLDPGTIRGTQFNNQIFPLKISALGIDYYMARKMINEYPGALLLVISLFVRLLLGTLSHLPSFVHALTYKSTRECFSHTVFIPYLLVFHLTWPIYYL